ncbi:MAG: hypothetical protein WCF85_07930, partial [Rhodospirillaceae bacterium]
MTNIKVRFSALYEYFELNHNIFCDEEDYFPDERSDIISKSSEVELLALVNSYENRLIIEFDDHQEFIYEYAFNIRE